MTLLWSVLWMTYDPLENRERIFRCRCATRPRQGCDAYRGSLGHGAGTVIESVLRYEALLDEANGLCADVTEYR